ncbi:MAG: hypothetical protein IJF39_05495 [Clostridia bacterium]|nr:hypothetical protein [Clostridia bacterium]
MKKFLLFIVIMLAIGLAGCSTSEKPNTSTPTPSVSGGGVQLPDQPF